MIIYDIIISSKNINSINNFISLINNESFNFLAIKKKFQKQNKTKILTILKSPHVNKTAQEQFETNTFLKQFSIQPTQNLKFLIFLKKLKIELFPDLKINIKFKINYKHIKSLGIKTFYIQNFCLDKFYNINNSNTTYIKLNKIKLPRKYKNKKLYKFLRLLELYGELLKINLSLGSSVGRAKD